MTTFFVSLLFLLPYFFTINLLLFIVLLKQDSFELHRKLFTTIFYIQTTTDDLSFSVQQFSLRESISPKCDYFSINFAGYLNLDLH